MPSRTAKTTKRASVEHRPQHLAWLADPANAAAYLEAALETGEDGDLMHALRDVIDAQGGVTKLAEDTGLNRETLYRTLSRRGNPQLSTLTRILGARGLKLTVERAR